LCAFGLIPNLLTVILLDKISCNGDDMKADVSMCSAENSKFLKLLFVHVHFWIFWMKCSEFLEIDMR
jgi:hypothetical protein